MEPKTPRKLTRNRELRACTECRRRKLKCDRQLPCLSCVRRNEAVSCLYEGRLGGQQSERERRVQAEARLEHLEQLIHGLSQSPQRNPSSNNGTDSGNSKNQAPDAVLYSGSTHWSAMLEDIEVLRAAITGDEENEDAEMLPDNGIADNNSVLFGSAQRFTFDQVCSLHLPSRPEADRLVSAYFKAKSVAAPFLHAPQFNRLYRVFWNDPTTASPLWTSILFSIFNVATGIMTTDPEAHTGRNGRPTPFATAAAHCLAIGGYNKPHRFAVEALLLYLQSECITSVDLSPDVAILFSTLVRSATAQGYHREPAMLGQGISAFDGEMRRRTWSLCMQLDMLISFQLGLPSNIQFPTWDTRPPSNLTDLDFDEDTLQLPPPRPDSEVTETLFYISKHKLLACFEKIVRLSLSLHDSPLDEVELLDQELRATYATLPVGLKSRPMTASAVDAPSVIVTRLCVNLIYQKCLCVLHRRHVTTGRQSSIQICHDAATSLVRQMLDTEAEFALGGQLETERWFMGSLTWHDFLLGCSALCLTICSTRDRYLEPTGKANINVLESLILLQNAIPVCDKQMSRSKATRRVRRLIQATILEFNESVDSQVPATGPDAIYNDQGAIFNPTWPTSWSSPGAQNWAWARDTTELIQDPSMTYMEQFLNLPRDDI